MAFDYIGNLAGNGDPIFEVQMAASATIKKGDLLKFVNGKATRSTANNEATPIVAEEDKVSDATSINMIKVRSTQAGMGKFKVGIVPLVDALVCKTNASKTTVILDLTTGSTGDLIGGVVYIKELDQARIITANTYSSNVVTITVAEPFSVAPTTTHKGSIVAAGVGYAPKTDGTLFYSTVSPAIVDRTGGKLLVLKVDIKRKLMHVTLNP